MGAAEEGLRSDALREALRVALGGGASAKLEDLLCRQGGGADPRPNLRLAAAVGAEMARTPAAPVPLLSKFGADDADAQQPRVFLPMVAAHGWVGLLRAGREQRAAWAALADLSADDRAPVRVATLDALSSFALRDGGAADLVTNASGWLSSLDDLDRRFAALALVLEVLAERRVLTSFVGDGRRQMLLDYLSRAIDEVAHAPRSAERLDGRRRLLMSLPPTLAAVVATFASDGGGAGPSWFELVCASASHPDLRKALSDTVLQLRNTSLGRTSAVAQHLRGVLEASAKPLRDPTRLRPGTGRGKASRSVR